MNKEKWEALLKEFWQSEYAPDEASLREGLIVKSFAEFCMVKEAAQQSAHADLLRADPRSAVAHPTSESTADNRPVKSATSG